ncbi:hypothetical protein NM688_g5914 [Phlebia brevispora]|uniref:Uncharacterized protein n=1 Tax=Phlebia brevispora TaxID=194682 RepID=A0ACC1SMR6_9APHY|nr:hypothetical protein NM688_g5914 [Phlebia brevispora]
MEAPFLAFRTSEALGPMPLAPDFPFVFTDLHYDGEDEEDGQWLSVEAGDDEDDEQEAQLEEGNDSEGGDGNGEEDYMEKLH